MKSINYSSSFRALKRFIEQYNATQDKIGNKIRQSAMCTAQDIIRIQGAYLTRLLNANELNLDDIPGIETNNRHLAKITNSSPRTVQRHIKKLQQAGIISQKVWRGTRANYRLWINPEILLVCPEKPILASEKQVNISCDFEEKEQALEAKRTNRLVSTEAGNNRYTNKSLIAVDNPEKNKEGTASDCQKSTGYTLTGYTGEKEGEKTKEAGEKGGSQRVEESFEEQLQKEDKARAASLNLYIGMLWTLAKQVLYQNVFITENQEKTALSLIREWYEPVSTKGLASVHKKYVQRIGLVIKYIEKDPQRRFVPLPYLYFDTNNLNGFRGTKKWHEDHLKRKKKLASKGVLFEQIRLYRSGLSKASGTETSPIKLYKECESRIRQLGDPELLDVFHSAILKSNNQFNPLNATA